LPTILEDLYAPGIKPDWWKLEPQESPAAWRRRSRHMILTVAALSCWVSMHRQSGLRRRFTPYPAFRQSGVFAVGRILFAPAAAAWFAGRMPDAAAITDKADRFGRLVAASHRARG
jgi:5-dehydro-2-deoxygluconokinase